MDSLDAYFASVRETPFTWGEHDCALFAAKAVDAQRASRWAAHIRGLNITTARAYRALLREGHTLKTLTIEQLGAPSSGRMQRGDVVLLRCEQRMLLGIAVPPLVFAAGPHGTMPLGTDHIICFWRTK